MERIDSLPMPRPRSEGKKAKLPIVQYTHDKETRVNNPPVGPVDADPGPFLEVKGQMNESALAKRAAADEWVEAVNASGRFGKWICGICEKPQQVLDLLEI